MNLNPVGSTSTPILANQSRTISDNCFWASQEKTPYSGIFT